MKKFKTLIRQCYLKFFCRTNNKRITIFSNNCIGGFLYKDFNIEYQSPTIGIQIPILDFIRYVNNYKYYNQLKLIKTDPFYEEFKRVGGDKIDFPCACLGDIRIMFQHEKNFKDAYNNWERRKQRINDDNIVVVIWAEKNIINEDVISKFNSIQYKKIILTEDKFSHKDIKTIKVAHGKQWWEMKNSFIKYFEEYNWKKFFNR